MEKETKIAITFSIIFFIIVIAIIIYSVVLTTNTVEASSCPQTTGDFGVQPNMAGVVLQNCGTTKTEQCTFNNITSLSDAVNQCNAITGCNAFEYSFYTNIMNVIDINSKIISNENFDVYVRQNPVLINHT